MNLKKGIEIILITAVMQALSYPVLNAQTDNRISCVALVRNDSIVLRWAPASLPLWQAGVKYGYNVTRYTIARDGAFIDDGLSKGTLISNSPVKPASEGYLEKLSAKIKEAKVVQEALYGEMAGKADGANDFGSFMKVYEENEVRLGFALFICDMFPDLAKAAGVQFVDHDIVSGERYAYTVSPSFIPDGLQVEQGVVIADAGRVTVLPPVIDVDALFNDRIVRLQWPVVHLRGIYSAYITEKSFDGKIFNPVSELPLVSLSDNENQDYFLFTDSLEDNETRVWYRITGISPFGIKGPPSETVNGKGAADFSAYASIDTGWVESGKKIVIKWRVSESPDSPVKGINVLRADNNAGPFIPLSKKQLPARERTFIDNKPAQSNYYQVLLEGEGVLRSYSFPYLVQTEDNEPPSAPEMLSGKVDSSGHVTIIWKKNPEPDLLGYKVFRANSAGEEFIALEQGIVPVNICHDFINMNTLAGKICYQVVAIDKNYNNSDYSRILELTRPDTIAPSPAIISRVSSSAGKVNIVMEGSPSNDVDHYELLRIEENDSISQTVAKWDMLLPSELDDTPGTSGYVNYILMTFDHAGNSAENRRMVFSEEIKKDQVNLSAEQSPDGKTITLNWQLASDFIPPKTIIYKGIEENPPSLFRTIEGGGTTFKDDQVELNTTYNYRIVVYSLKDHGVFRSGRLSFKPSGKNSLK